MVYRGEQPTPRVGLGVAHERNRELLTQLLADHDTVAIAEEIPDGTDFCIIDEPAVSRIEAMVAEWRSAQHPMFAPVLLLAQDDTDDPWARYSDVLSEVIDAIVQVPVSKAGLSTRVENLLEMRAMSRNLVQEHQLTELVFDTSPLAKLVLDTEQTIVRANERATDLFGLSKVALTNSRLDDGDWTAVTADGTPIPEEDLPFTEVIGAGEPVYDYEHGLERPEGDRLWLRVNMAPILDDCGDVEYVVGTFEDVTVRRAQERELERQVDLFEKAQTLADVGAWEHDVRTETTYWTEEVYRIHGLDPETEVSPAVSLQHYHPEDRPQVEAAFERAIERGEPYDVQVRLIDASDDQRWVRTQGEPQSVDGTVVRVRGTIQDITDRKERELELRQMTDAVDTAPVGVTLSDPSQEDNPLVYVNDAFVEMTGYAREEALGRNCRFLQGKGTDPETVAEIRRAIDAEQRVSVELRNYRADGTEFWNHLEIAPVRDDDGAVINYIGFQQDVTEQVEQRRQLTVLDRYLRHNLRNDMNIVSGLAEQIQAEGEPPLVEYAADIEATAEALLSNMDKERKIAKLLRSDPVVETVDLVRVVQSAAETVQERYPAAEISVSGPDAVWGAGTEYLLLAFEELISNGVVHSESGRPRVGIEVLAEGNEAVVRIRDDGPGMPEMEADVLTGSNPGTAVRHGQGLGLWLVYLILGRCGGSASVETNEDGGSTVWVRLPGSAGGGN